MLIVSLIPRCGTSNICFVKNDAPLSGVAGTVTVTAIKLADGSQKVSGRSRHCVGMKIFLVLVTFVCGFVSSNLPSSHSNWKQVPEPLSGSTYPMILRSLGRAEITSSIVTSSVLKVDYFLCWWISMDTHASRSVGHCKFVPVDVVV